MTRSGRARSVALLLLFFSLAASAAAQTEQPRTDSEKPAPTYDGEWWLALGSWEQYGIVSGYEDCYAFEYRGSAPFTKEVQSYIDDLNRYFLGNPARRKESLSEALDLLRGASGDKPMAAAPGDASAAPGDAPAAASGGLDGRFWFDADPAAELGFVEGFLACHAAKLKDADAKFSKEPSEYVELINKAYDITDDTDDVDPGKAVMKLAEVLHRLKDEAPAPAPQKPGAAAVYLPFKVSASLSLISAWRVTPMRLAS